MLSKCKIQSIPMVAWRHSTCRFTIATCMARSVCHLLVTLAALRCQRPRLLKCMALPAEVADHHRALRLRSAAIKDE